jgi:hypothetical protein
MQINTGSTRLYRIELLIVVTTVVAMVAMSGTAAAAANSASVSASANPVPESEPMSVTGEIDLQALFWCGGYTLETHLADEMERPAVLSTNTGGGSLTMGYSDTMNERAWQWDSGFQSYCFAPTKYVKLATETSQTGYTEVAAGSDYFATGKWEQARVYVYLRR